MKIGLISDSHGYMSNDVLDYLRECDEIWHAGDIGDVSVINKLETLKIPLQVVFGNIDHKSLQIQFEEDILMEREGIKIFMTHIGNYPPRYTTRVRAILERERPNLYVCGHSHILKVMPDRQLDLLHMNPGAIGHHGIHQIRTLLTFHIHQQKISEVNVIELGRRGKK
jgi:putative phosphoesterase